MFHEYDGPFNARMVIAAVATALQLHRLVPEQSLETQIGAAIHRTAYSCAIDIEDAIEGRRSGLHEAIFQEVRSGVERELATRQGRNARGPGE